jgi:hypothetical protein
MKSSTLPTARFGTIGRQVAKVTMALALATTLGSFFLSPAFAERNDGDRQDNRDHGHDRRQWHSDHKGNFAYERENQHPYRYAQPVYTPPPVYYEPHQSPGINLFFPFDRR